MIQRRRRPDAWSHQQFDGIRQSIGKDDIKSTSVLGDIAHRFSSSPAKDAACDGLVTVFCTTRRYETSPAWMPTSHDIFRFGFSAREEPNGLDASSSAMVAGRPPADHVDSNVSIA
uniref:Uncharacterized protein n=1 Tax=Oryza meridionalis TaxID=40149 RepID=A0A0E0D7V9_9ORYZ